MTRQPWLWSLLLVGCTNAPPPERPSEPAPEPPAMVAPAETDRYVTWSCEDDTVITTRWDAGRDTLHLDLAGVEHTLERSRHVPSAAWAGAGLRFEMDGAEAIFVWEGEGIRCQRSSPP